MSILIILQKVHVKSVSEVSFPKICIFQILVGKRDELPGQVKMAGGILCQGKLYGVLDFDWTFKYRDNLSLQQIRLFLQLFGQSLKPKTLSSTHFFNVDLYVFAELSQR